MLGSLANTHGALRWAFAVARWPLRGLVRRVGLRRTGTGGPLGRPTTWRALDVVVGLVMVVLAVCLCCPEAGCPVPVGLTRAHRLLREH
jgi:L-lysine exporter family protein LysE/ArgO